MKRQERWNYEDEQWEYHDGQNWVFDFNKTEDLRAAFNKKDFAEALSGSESWATLCRRWGYTKAYLGRLIDQLILEDLSAASPEASLYVATKKAVRKDGKASGKKDEAILKKWDPIVKATKKKMRARPETTRAELREKNGQIVRPKSVFEIFGVKLPQ
tara:strand:- start:1431 stop:1904 length:474 start_codon:yes stop_codon:yes gene_type:complete